jgi:hypothetical protein
LVGYLALFATCVAAWPAAWLWRKARQQEPRPIAARRTARRAALTGALILAILASLLYVLRVVADADPNPLFERLPVVWNVVVAATWASLVAGALFLRQFMTAWGAKKLSWPATSYYSLVALAVVSWAPYAYYWDLLLPAR